MGWTVSEILDAVAARLSDVTGIRAYGFSPDAPNPPCHVVTVGAIQPSTITAAHQQVAVSIVTMVGRSSDRVGHGAIYAALSHNGDGSVRDALWPAGGGDYLDVPGLGFQSLTSAAPGAVSLADAEYLAVEHTLTVIPRRA